MTNHSLASHSLDWAHGRVTVQRQSGMIGPVTFRMGGRDIMPLHTAPWVDTPLALEYPGILSGLRGEWPCVPFGVEGPKPDLLPSWQKLALRPTGLPPDAPAHGNGSHGLWDWQTGAPGMIAMSITYPDDHPIARLDRIIRPDPDAPALDFTLIVTPRADCRLPIGLHPTMHLPQTTGMATLHPGPYRQIRTYPGTLEPGASVFAPDRVFASLTQTPLRDGTTLDTSQLPAAQPFEELLLIEGTDGTFALHNHAEGYRVHLAWNADHFPSLNLWLSNRGRAHAPWSGRHLALGVEPVAAAFDLGTAISAGPNPIAVGGSATAHDFRAGQPFTTTYRIGVSPG